MGRPVKDIAGQVFGRLTAVARRAKSEPSMWECRCVCGSLALASLRNLQGGSIQSCGCYRREKLKTHGLSRTPTYEIWKAMRKRCSNPNDPSYASYGGRGIAVCKRWERYTNFLVDMGERPIGLSLERRNNHKGYAPTNCYWATRLEQNANTRTNRYIAHRGVIHHLAEWARITKIPADTIRARLDVQGWSVADALEKPLRGKEV